MGATIHQVGRVHGGSVHRRSGPSAHWRASAADPAQTLDKPPKLPCGLRRQRPIGAQIRSEDGGVELINRLEEKKGGTQGGGWRGALAPRLNPARPV